MANRLPAARVRITRWKWARVKRLPQFEEAVAGLQVGVRQNVQVSYPENYPNKEIAGKAVDFSLVAREIKQKVLPVLDDEFAKDHGECASLDELRDRIRDASDGRTQSLPRRRAQGKNH